jgi:hypothetical protein
MADFIPGESYRLDVVGADGDVLVDSWTSQLKASVVSKAGALQVDVDTGKIFGPLIGDIEDVDGTLIFDASLNVFKTNLVGEVRDRAGNVIVDAEAALVTADLEGDILDAFGSTIVNSTDRRIDADAIYGTFYGDLIGSVTSDTTLFGAFSGDFNGSHYGDFYGDITGNVTGSITGDVVGNMTGVVTGSLIGEVMADETTSLMSPPDENHNQHNWLGGIAHTVMPPEDAIAKGPIVVLGDDRTESALRGHVQHYDGRPIVTADIIGNAPWVAEHFGKFRGELYSADDNSIISYNQGSGQVYVNSYGILTFEANDAASDIEFMSQSITFNVKGPQTVRSFNGTWHNKSALLPDDCVLQFDAEGFDGNGWRQAGGFGIYVADEPINNTAYNAYFGVALSDGVNGPAANENKGLIFDSAGVLRTPIAKVGSHTYAQRDSMSAEAGMIIFNSSSNKFEGYNGSAWVVLG